MVTTGSFEGSVDDQYSIPPAHDDLVNLLLLRHRNNSSGITLLPDLISLI